MKQQLTKSQQKHLSQNTRWLVNQSGLGTTEYAEAIGIPQWDISDLKYGRVGHDRLAKFAAAIGRSITELISGPLSSDAAELSPDLRPRVNGRVVRRRRYRTKSKIKPGGIVKTEAGHSFLLEDKVSVRLGGKKEPLYLTVGDVELCVEGPAGKKVTIEVS